MHSYDVVYRRGGWQQPKVLPCGDPKTADLIAKAVLPVACPDPEFRLRIVHDGKTLAEWPEKKTEVADV